MNKEKQCNYWNRPCKTKGCFGIARPFSDYCQKCHKERQEIFKKNMKEIEEENNE